MYSIFGHISIQQDFQTILSHGKKKNVMKIRFLQKKKILNLNKILNKIDSKIKGI